MDEGRCAMAAEPAPDPSFVQLLPSVVIQSPPFATPAMTRFEQGSAATRGRLPHSDASPARFAVAFTRAAAGAAEGVTLHAKGTGFPAAAPPTPDPPLDGAAPPSPRP